MKEQRNLFKLFMLLSPLLLSGCGAIITVATPTATVHLVVTGTATPNPLITTAEPEIDLITPSNTTTPISILTPVTNVTVSYSSFMEHCRASSNELNVIEASNTQVGSARPSIPRNTCDGSVQPLFGNDHLIYDFEIVREAEHRIVVWYAYAVGPITDESIRLFIDDTLVVTFPPRTTDSLDDIRNIVIEPMTLSAGTYTSRLEISNFTIADIEIDRIEIELIIE